MPRAPLKMALSCGRSIKTDPAFARVFECEDWLHPQIVNSVSAACLQQALNLGYPHLMDAINGVRLACL